MHHVSRIMKLSIVIVSWNTWALLRECLDSVFAYSPRCEFDVWVVDNASSDDSAAMVRAQFPQVRLTENRDNVGFARANNQAIQESEGEYVLLLNSDTKVKPGALENLVAFMDSHSEAGAAGARLLNPDGTLQSSCYPAPTLSREVWRLFHLDALRLYGSYNMADWNQEEVRAVDVLLGACLMLRRQVLDQVGWLDGDYFMYSEEVDLCYRIQQAGWPLYWVPTAEIIHYGGQSTRQVAADMFLRLYQGKLLYFRKNHGPTAAQMYKLILLAASLTRLVLSPLAWLAQPSQRQQQAALASRYWQLVMALAAL